MSSLAARLAALGPLDPDAVRWANAVRAAGSTISPARVGLVSGLVILLKQSKAGSAAPSDWTLTDDYWLLCAENATQALISLKQRRLATATNSPAFTADRGYVFDGSTNYIDTGFVPSAHAAAMTESNVAVAVYERTNVFGNNYTAGAITSSARALRIGARNSSVSQGGVNTNSLSFTLPAADSRGLTSISRNGATAANCMGYKNGAAMPRAGDPTTFGSLLPAHALFIGGYNNAGVATAFRACTVGFVCAGAALSEAQELARYNAVQTFMVAVGASV